MAGFDLNKLLLIGAVGIGGYLLLARQPQPSAAPEPPTTQPPAHEPPTSQPPVRGNPADSVEQYEGRFIRASGDTIWLVQDGHKRRFQDWESFRVQGGEGDLSNVYPVTDVVASRIPDGPAMPRRQFSWRASGSFLKVAGSQNPTIWRVDGGQRRRLPDWETFLAIGGQGNLSNVYQLTWSEMSSIPEGPVWPSVQRGAGPSGQRYQIGGPGGVEVD